MKKIYIIVFLLLLGSNIQPIEAKGEKEIELSFNLTVENLFPYEIVVGKGGKVRDGGARIRDGTLVYEMRVGESKEFIIEPDLGYQVQSIECDRKLEIEGNRVTIHQVSSKSVLKVSFEKITENERPGIEVPSGGKPTGGKGDSSSNTHNISNKYKNKNNNGVEEILEVIPEMPIAKQINRIPTQSIDRTQYQEIQGNGINISMYVLPVIIGGIAVLWIVISKKRKKEEEL